MRRKITNETWEQIKTGFAAGAGLREMARVLDIPENAKFLLLAIILRPCQSRAA